MVLQHFNEPPRLIEFSVATREQTQSTQSSDREETTPIQSLISSYINPLSLSARHQKHTDTAAAPAIIKTHHWREFVFDKLELTADRAVRNAMIITIYLQSIRDSSKQIHQLLTSQSITKVHQHGNALQNQMGMLVFYQHIQELDGVIRELFKTIPEVYKTQSMHKMIVTIQNMSRQVSGIKIFLERTLILLTNAQLQLQNDGYSEHTSATMLKYDHSELKLLCAGAMQHLITIQQTLQAILTLIDTNGEILYSEENMKTLPIMVNSVMKMILPGIDVKFEFECTFYDELSIQNSRLALYGYYIFKCYCIQVNRLLVNCIRILM